MKTDRILLKLSGEALSGGKGTGFDEATVMEVAEQIKKVVDAGKQVSIVIGGGNFWRGRTSGDMDRVKADSIGMLATVMNCIYTSDALRRVGLETVIMTPFQVGGFTQLFNKDKAIKSLNKGKVVFFAGGTGHPYFSTDMSTVLMAIETESDVILSAKSIDGVYDSDPATNPDAKKYDELPMQKIVDDRLGVIDLASAVLALENKMPMMLFGLNEKDSIVNALTGKFTGTTITV
ncbi:MAG: UMP kinase [Lachnospiraceae bacterium]|nr:UMP kinase [Lachnospiraceae bacterium]